MALMGTGISSGWIFAGCLIAALAVWMAVMFREIRNAPDCPEYFSPEDNGDGYFPIDDAPAPSGPFFKSSPSRSKPTRRSAKGHVRQCQRQPSPAYSAGQKRVAQVGGSTNL